MVNQPNTIRQININPQEQIYKDITFKQKQQFQEINRARSPQSSQIGMKNFQLQNGQLSPLKQIPKNGMIPPQRIKTFQITTMEGKRINSDNNNNKNVNLDVSKNISSARKLVSQLNTINNGNFQKIPLINRNNTPNLIQRRMRYLKTDNQLNQVQLSRVFEQTNKNQENNLMMKQRVRNGVSPNVQKIGMRPTLNYTNNFRHLNISNNY